VDWFSQKPRQKASTLSHIPSQPQKGEILNPAENPSFNTPAKIGGIACLVCTWALIVAFATILVRDEGWKSVISLLAAVVLIFGSLFAALVWGTHRHFGRKRSVNER
jgi:hypothetical protein